jgi:hypothetical protein
MANRSTLIFSDTPAYSDDCVGTGVLAWDWAIATLWFALFQSSDMRHFEYVEKVEDDEDQDEERPTYQVPYLVTSAESARRNLQLRKASLVERLSPAGRQGLALLEAKLGEVNGFVILDMWEVWNMSGEEFEPFVGDCIARMDAGDLSPVLDHSHIRQSGDDHPEPYCGYGWATGSRQNA